MRRFAIVTTAVAALLVTIPDAHAAGDTVDRMALFRQLVGGTWSCATQAPVLGAAPVHRDHSTAAFEMVSSLSGDVLHDHIVGQDYAGDFYIGYSDRLGEYWMTGADALGTDISLTSKDGLHYDGTASMGGITMKDSATYQNFSDKTLGHEVFSRPGVQAIFDTVCTR